MELWLGLVLYLGLAFGLGEKSMTCSFVLGHVHREGNRKKKKIKIKQP